MTFAKSLSLSFCILLFAYTSTNFAIAQSTSDYHCITFDSVSHTIIVSCKNGTLSQVSAVLSDKNVLKEESKGIWHLNANLFLDKDSTFVIAPYDTKWLKINTPFGVKSLGSLIINSVKITSWDDNSGTYPSTDGTVPRPYLIEDNEATGQMNITNSEIAYLGYAHFDRQGIAYIGGDGSVVSNNDIHDMWYGFYSAERADITVTNNHIHDNERYGIDPHTVTHRMTIRNNTVDNIRDGIGIICSDKCSEILIEDNVVYNASRAGIMLDATNESIVRNNVEYNSMGAGIAVHNSAINKVYNNTIYNNRYGVKISLNSTVNQIIGNRISNSSDFGLCIMENSTRNDVKLNWIAGSKNYGICIVKGALRNNVESNIISDSLLCGIIVNDYRLNVIKNNTLSSSDECAPVKIHKYF